MSVQNDITAADGWFKDEDKSITFTVKQAGVAISISGWTLSFRLADQKGTAADVTRTTGGSGITIATQSGATLGQATVVIPASSLTVFNLGTEKCFYSFRRTDSGSAAELAYGNALIQDSYVA